MKVANKITTRRYRRKKYINNYNKQNYYYPTHAEHNECIAIVDCCLINRATGKAGEIMLIILCNVPRQNAPKYRSVIRAKPINHEYWSKLACENGVQGDG